MKDPKHSLRTFFHDENLDDDFDLIASHILDSLGTQNLMLYIEDVFSIEVFADEVTPQNFKNLNSITKYILNKLNNKKELI